MNFQAIASEAKPTVKGMVTKKYASILEHSYKEAINEYIENRSTPKKLFSYFNKTDARYLKKLMDEKNVSRLPKIISYKKGHYLLFKGNKVYLSPTFAYNQEIIFNGKKFLFDKNLSVIENSQKLQHFMGAKKVTFLSSFIMNEAQAFVCGGFCVGALVVGTIAFGVMAASKVNSFMNGSSGELKKFREEIKNKKKQCDTDLNNVESHSSYFNKYNKSPGSFETFENLKKVSNFIEKSDSEKSKVQEQLYKDYGFDNLKNCGEFAKNYQSKIGIADKKKNRLAEAMGKTAQNPDSKGAICTEINEYIDCLNQFDQVHKGHVNQGDGYKKDIGVYYESDAYSNSRSK
ncbi:MAG: hypothetical protein ACJARO_002238 [Bacteriovoracaceae bacterium]|jgi:hypothetical protein